MFFFCSSFLRTHYSYNINDPTSSCSFNTHRFKIKAIYLSIYLKKLNTYLFFLTVVLEFHCPMHQTKHNQLTSTQKKAQLRWKETGVQNPYTQKLLQICLH